MHPGLSRLFKQLAELRTAAGLTEAEVEQQLVMGPGWVSRFESGDEEPTIGTLAALLHLYRADIGEFFGGLELGDSPIVPDRHLTATQQDADLRLHFPMGPYSASVTLPRATLEDFNAVLKVMRDELASGTAREAIVSCFLAATRAWPHANPSDLWYFVLGHAYQDDYNHPAFQAGKDWGQSWKRASGWALEEVILRHYNPVLSSYGIRLAMPTPDERTSILESMDIANPVEAAQKADVVALAAVDDERWEGLGVVHVKASFAERRTDDVPLSQQLIARGYASPFVTMDCKAAPAESPINRGELGPIQEGADAVSAKRLDIERDKKFDACFSFNRNTLPTPAGTPAAARIYILDFNNSEDALSEHLIRTWRVRQGY